MPPTPSVPSGGGGRRAALIVLVVVLLAGVGAGAFFGVRALTDDSDSGSATEEPSASPSESASESPTEEPPTAEPSSDPPATEPTTAPTAIPAACTAGDPQGGRAPGAVLRGGGLQAPNPPGFTAMGLDAVFTFADQVVAVGREVEANWIAVYALGGLDRATGYSSLQQAAESVLTCMTGSDTFYAGFSGRTDQGSGAIDIGGHEAWRITAEVRVDDPQVTVEGDVATVIVVDTGAPGTYGLFVSVVPIGDANLIGQQEQVIGALTVR